MSVFWAKYFGGGPWGVRVTHYLREIQGVLHCVSFARFHEGLRD